MPSDNLRQTQQDIIKALNVQPPFETDNAVHNEINRRVAFIADAMLNSNTKTLVLGISGGVDSTTAGMLAQRAVERLRSQGHEEMRFIAVRLPHKVQKDEDDAQLAIDTIKPDETETVNIGDAVDGLAAAVQPLQNLSPEARDFALGNVKARMRMIAQYTIANARNGLVIGTDHAAEAVMGFFTKFGDGACDLAPLGGLVKDQVRALAKAMGAPEKLHQKVPTADLEELNPGRPDEDAYGVTYQDIDRFLHGQDVSDDVAEIIIQKYFSTQHKRDVPPTP
ncbi:ammonia-dependent NAD(+) synthetase [Phytohalomonas tamaricis]|uniref:ammonia-dependent NAD(+) synthetase n=1 Tax=Phytohalomonas tamaricis TaxID=2081032 RepID=UPI000D0BDC15|nr:ammonia-dependent NAD(+) synthetase [Phytohalomonas tamaricis]